MKNDQRLIRKIRSNQSESAANALISKYYKEIFAFVYKQTLDQELSLDLTQEIFIALLRSMDHYNEAKAAFRTWLYRVATNKMVDYYRSKNYKHSRQLELTDAIELMDQTDLFVRLEYKEDFARANQLIAQLDSKSQQILRLKLFAEYTFKEISEVMSLSESTIKARYYTELKKIRKAMREQDGEK